MTYEEIFQQLGFIVSTLRTARNDNQVSETAFMLLEEKILRLRLNVKVAIDTQDDLK